MASHFANLHIFLQLLIMVSLVGWARSKFLLLVDDPKWILAFSRGLVEFEDANPNLEKFDVRAVPYKNDSNWDEVCQVISTGISAVFDLTHQIDMEMKPQTFFKEKLIPYYKVDVPLDSLIKGANALMEAKNASNGFLIFHGENDVSRGVHLILGHTLIRYAFLDAITMSKLIVEKFDYRIPSGVLLFGTGQQFEEFIKANYKVVRNRTEWIFLFNTFQGASVTSLNVTFPYLRGYFDSKLCCLLRVKTTENNGGTCDVSECSGDPSELYLKKLAYLLSKSLNEISTPTKKHTLTCTDKKTADTGFQKDFTTKLIANSEKLFTVENDRLVLAAPLIFDEVGNKSVAGGKSAVGQYDKSVFTPNATYTFRKRPRYYRIGIVNFKPWTFKDKNGNWIGYCIDLARGIAERMKFEFDFVESDDFGRRNPDTGRWDGLTGDLVHGKIDIAIAAYIMTSEREEFIDFVSPYYEQSGLIITMQRPIVKNSLFKFMTVLRAEVWLSIAGATVATGFMLWFLDKFSPYSAQNNPHKYKSFRKFTLKESFWFALTSFTPQGGGEPPKAFSGRTLVAAYWIFVVLMLATFTANLAAFLTVERMQSPIRNLEHLAGQSSVKYSVVEGSTALRFFQNMANAEETLYQMWRNLTLSAPSSAKQYVVWEYPIREQYIHINSVIDKTGLVKNFSDGLKKAEEDEYFAFIHDAAQTRYEVFQNCNLTLIGEPFAESPYAIAVAQGNPLQDDISMAILELQTNRFFESLSSQYWTNGCPNLGEGESDGISLESLGGVFIATIIGLGIAFISLAIEVFTTARNRRKAKIEADNIIKPKFVGPMDFYGATKKGDGFRKVAFMPEVIN